MIVCPYCATTNDSNVTICKTCGASLDGAQFPTALRIGTLLQNGKYKLEKVLGQGGFGITYKAQNIALGIPVVVKEYHPSGSSRVGTSVRPPGTLSQTEFADARVRFADEARVVAKLTLISPNPHIVRVYDVFTENDSEYYTMEFLEGKSLQSLVEKGGSLSEPAVLEITQQISSALDLVHDAGLLHRDIKPDNIMMVQRGAVLIDFGSARMIANTGAKMQEYLGVTPPDDRDGVMQDIHWSSGYFAYFPTYSLGNILSVGLFEKAESQMGDLHAMFARGEFKPLLHWLTHAMLRYGKTYLPTELIERATGSKLSAAPYLRYLTKKFSGIYSLESVELNPLLLTGVSEAS